MTMPYMLAGTGSGSAAFNSSPIKDIKRIIKNCFKQFNVNTLLAFALIIAHSHHY